FPGYQPAAAQTLEGLSGGGCLIVRDEQRLVLREQRQSALSHAQFLRQYRALRRLPDTLAATARFCAAGWMAVDYLPGEVKTTLPDATALACVLSQLHHQPRFGWRVLLQPLLEQSWQTCDPGRRSPGWLRELKRLSAQGEPQPLRLSPLHMDIHPGNLVHTADGLRLIDWEYAGDGDIALELAAVWSEDRKALVMAYAREAGIDAALLWRQVLRWRPWVLMLMAGWYECRWQQTGDRQFITLADEIWRQRRIKD
ncbi:MAG TPA: thiamine kinase, partial [Enterobacteriaceae bacterium]|nr:thiamine kinase [Enterobacteriaceae bacterium]